MKKIIRAAVIPTAVAFSTAVFMQTTTAADTVIEVSSLASSGSEFVNFTAEEKPVEIENTLFVPLRIMAESMGMKTGWDSENERATISIKADCNSEKPIERYAYELCSWVGQDDETISPEALTVTMKHGSQMAVVRYNFDDGCGGITAYSKTEDLGKTVQVVNGGTMMFPLRSVTEAVGLELDWEQQHRKASIAIPEAEVLPTDAVLVTDNSDMEKLEPPIQEVEEVKEEESKLKYLGTFKITHYSLNQNNTAWAGKVNPGVTIAVDKNVIPPLSWVYIDGYGYRRAEDCGGAIKGNKIDVAVSTYQEAIKLGVVYKDVYLCLE